MNKTIITLIIGSMLSLSTCTSNTQKSESNVEFFVVSSDVELYYNVIDQAQTDGVELDGQYLYDHYISKGSEGLQATYNQFTSSVEKVNPDADPLQIYWESFQKNMEFLAINRESLLKNRYLFTEQDLKYAQQRLASFLDEDFSSTFYFILSNATMGGTAFEKGVIIDLSMVYTEDNDYSKFWLPAFVEFLPKAGNDALFLFVHEIMHQLQATYLEKDNLSSTPTTNTVGDLLMVEGGAHFFADLLLGEEFRSNSYYAPHNKYYQDNPQIMIDVLAAKNSDEQEIINQWFFNYQHERANNAPPDMGYFLGAVICRDYYDRAENKKKAFIDIVRYWKNKDNIIESYREANLK